MSPGAAELGTATKWLWEMKLEDGGRATNPQMAEFTRVPRVSQSERGSQSQAHSHWRF